MIEANALTNLLSRLSEARSRQQETARQPKPKPQMPEWSRRLDPNDFTGTTREMLLRAQGAAPVAGGGAPQLTSEELADLVPFDTRPRQAPVSPDTRQRVSPVPASSRQRIVGQEAGYSPEIAAHMGRESEERAARRDQVAREDAVHPHPDRSPDEQPTHVNLRKAFGSEVGGAGGSYIDMQRRYRQTGELPGGNAPAARQQGPAPAQMRPEPAAHRGGGGGGLPWRALLGGAGAIMQELGGRQGAVERFAQVHGARRAAALEANQTRAAAISLGMDPELVEQMPIPVLTPLLSKLYEQKNARPEPIIGKPGDVARHPVTGEILWQNEEASGQTIPGTNIGADTDMGRKYSAYVNQGFSHEQALGVASGRFDLRITDTGNPVMIDTLTNQEVPVQRLGPAEIEQREQLGPTPGRRGQSRQGQPERLGLDPQRDRTLYELAESGTGLWNIAGDFLGRVTPQFVPGNKAFFADQREAITTIQTANRGLIRAIQQSPRYAEGERASIEKEIALNPSIGMSPEAWRESAVSVDRLLRNWWTEDMQDARANNLAATDRQRALASARSIERYLQILGVPQGGGQGAGQGQPQDQSGGQGGPVSVTSPAEAQSLPPGTVYVTPDGKRYRR